MLIAHLLLLAMVPLSLVKRDGVDFYTMPLNHHSRRKVGIQLEDKALSSSTPQNNFLLRAETLIGLVWGLHATMKLGRLMLNGPKSTYISMGTGSTQSPQVWYSPKSYPNQTRNRELKNKKEVIQNLVAIYFSQVFFLSNGGL